MSDELILFPGPYFARQFIMGGESFASIAPEAFLFGDMNDINFLARAPGVVSCTVLNVH